MTISRTFLALVAVLGITACTQEQGSAPGSAETSPAEVSLETREQRLSYGIAYGLGQRLAMDGVPVDADAFNAGIKHALEGTDPLLTQEEIGAEMQAYQQEQQAAREAEMNASAEVNAQQGAAFLAENANKEGVTVLESGLQYSVITMGDGPKPGPSDTVEVHYRGTLIDGTEFDSSYSRNSTVSFGVTQVIPGWTEALQLMPVGSKWNLYIPSELAYGPGGAGGAIGPNATLIFEVELISIAP